MVEFLSLKLIGFATFFATSAFGCMTPIVLNRLVSHRFFFFLLPVLIGIGVGVILSTAFVHIIPSSMEFFNEALPDNDYPYSLVIAVLSVPIGVTFGFLDSHSRIISLLIAISFHQLTEGFALGTMIVSNRLRPWHIAILCLLFSLTTPLGVLIGMLLSFSVGKQTKAALLMQGVFTGIASGLLVYVGCAHLLVPIFTQGIPEMGDKSQQTTACTFAVEEDPASFNYEINEKGSNHQSGGMDDGLFQENNDASVPEPLALSTSESLVKSKRRILQPIIIRLISYVAMVFGASIMCALAIWL